MANTPFLDLVKPAGTDHALVSVINSNSDKIDAGVGTLSEQIGKKIIRVPETGTISISAAITSGTIATVTDSRIKSTHRVVGYTVGAPANQTSPWTVTTSNGSLTVAGTCNLATSLVLYLVDDN